MLTNQRRWNVNRGFTLVELLLAVMLLSIMMTIVYGVIISTLKGQKQIETINRSSEIGPGLLAQIRQDLDGAFLPDAEGVYFVGYNRAGASGDRDRVDFVTSRIAYGADLDEEQPVFHSVNEVGYQVRGSERDAMLGVLYRREDYFLDKEPVVGGRLVELYDRVLHFSVTYYREGEWLDSWDGEKLKGVMPEAVKVDLRLQMGDGDETVERTFVTIVTYPK